MRQDLWLSAGGVALLAAVALTCPRATAQERARLVESDRNAAQETETRDRTEPVFREEIEVTEVLLDVLVTDKRGEVITGLGPEDFVVTEGDKEPGITSVTFYGDPASLQASGTLRTDRYFVLFFHTEKGVAAERTLAWNRLARDAKKWVKKELLPNDQVAVLSYRFSLNLHQDFTRDTRAVLAAIDDAVARRPVEEEPVSPSLPGQLGEDPSLFVNLPRGKELNRESRRFMQAMDLVARAGEGVVGRKNLVLFSTGFGQTPGFGELEPESREYRRMKRSLNTANVAVYAVDVPRIAQDGPPTPLLHEPLREISRDTGGRYYARETSFLAPLRHLTEENRGYYLISYQSGYEAGTSGYRNVDVDTRDKSHRVRARRGYRYGEVQ
jgi:VWFA-related protein